MKKRKSLYILLLTLVLLAGILIMPSIAADAGNFSGGSDYGGGGWSGGDYDWGSSGSGGVYIIGSGGNGGGGGAASIVLAVIIIVVIIFFVKGRAGRVVAVGGAASTELLSPLSSLKEKDPNFSEAAFEEKVANLYVQMQQAWQDKDFEPMRPHMTDALYNQFDRQLAELVRANRTNYVERIAVLGADINGWREDEVNDAIVVTVQTRIVDYTVDDSTGKLVSGSKTAEKFMTYEWTLIRSKGMTTPETAGEGSEGTVSIHCPSCGAPLNINQSSKCPYCGSVVSARDYDWAISAIKGISQRTAG